MAFQSGKILVNNINLPCAQQKNKEKYYVFAIGSTQTLKWVPEKSEKANAANFHVSDGLEIRAKHQIPDML